MTTGKTVGSLERQQNRGLIGSAPQLTALSVVEMSTPNPATDDQKRIYPQGSPRGGEDELPVRTDFLIATNDYAQRTNETTCICGKTCKNQRGLKIHQGKMKCTGRSEQTRRIGVPPSQTEEEQGPVSTHSAQHHQAPAQSLPDKVITKRIKWPPANNKNAWREFDEDVCELIQATSSGNVDQRLKTMSRLIVSYAAERFGHLEKSGRKPHTLNRREERIKGIRQELRSLKKRYRTAKEEQRPALGELKDILRKKLKTLCRAEGHRRRRRERARKRASFIADPFGFARRLLGDKRSGRLQCSKDEVDTFLQNTLGDPYRDTPLDENTHLKEPELPKRDFDMRIPSWIEVKNIVMAARSASSPGPSGVPYSVYKRCPGLLKMLWKFITRIWRRGKIVEQWRYAEGVWIPKEENSTSIEQFRSISLLSTESKIFFSVVSRRLTDFLMKNEYLDTSVQKGGIPGMPGCQEHTGVVSQLIRDARKSKGDLAVAWLDLANAYGSLPHKMVEFILLRHHVPEKIRELICDYYQKFHLRISSGLITSDWHRLEKGIITGCTISATLFTLAMNMMVKSAETECRGPASNSGVRQPPIRAYMDDLTVTTPSVTGCRWLLRGLEKQIKWARMQFKPSKCRSVVIKKGKVAENFHFRVEGREIPTLSEKPVKSLGKWFCSSLKDTPAINEACMELDSWMGKLDKSGLPGRFKAWLFHHAVLPRLLWPLQIYSVPMSAVEQLERRINSFLRRWLGLPRCLSSTALYGTSNALQLPFKGLVEEFIVSRTREACQYRYSKDPKVAGAGIEVRTGRKWSAIKELDIAEERLRVKTIVGTIAVGKTGLGFSPSTRVDQASREERQHLLQEEVRTGVEERRLTKMVGCRQQGAWTKWEQTERRKVSWADIWSTDFSRTRFLLQMVYDTLPSPANLCLWGKKDTPKCPLCPGIGTLQHILSGCKVALTEGRYRWRHDKVLESVAVIITDAIQTSKFSPGKRAIPFVRAGDKPPTARRDERSLLSSAPDWQLRVDLINQLKFPPHITRTSLRPDIVLFSDSTKQVILLELTVPWEENMEEAYERKLSKYQELLESCRTSGWRTCYFPVEIGCRGFAGRSMVRALTCLGITGQKRRRAIKLILEAAEKTTRWLWIQRSNPWSSRK